MNCAKSYFYGIYTKQKYLECVREKGKDLITAGSNLGPISSSNRNYFMNSKQVDKLSFKSEQIVEEEPKVRRRDIYAEMPIRALGYSNELGEAIRPLSPMLANLSWLPAIGYISADIADKYKQDEYAHVDPSKGRASKQFVTQMLASVLLPTCAVKVGQSLVNNIASFGKQKLNLNHREQISDVIIDSMKAGEHKNFLNDAGKVDTALYKESLSGKLDEIIKHRKTHKKLMKPFELAWNFIKAPFIKKPTMQNIKKYAGDVVDRMVENRQQLLDGIKPKTMSKRAFKKFVKMTKDLPAEEKQSLAFNAVRKLEKGRMFNNRILKSVGGLMALAVMAKPIDKFVESIVVDKYVGPQIDNISELYRRQLEAQKNKA